MNAIRVAAHAIPPSVSRSSASPISPSSAAVSSSSECASRTVSSIVRFSSQVTANEPAPAPTAGSSAKPFSAACQ